MNKNAIPYLILHRDVKFGDITKTVYVCLCLIDHMVLGIGESREESLKSMANELDKRYPDDGDELLEILSRN